MRSFILVLFAAAAISVPCWAEEAKAEVKAQIEAKGEVKPEPAKVEEPKKGEAPQPAKAEEPKKEEAIQPAKTEAKEAGAPAQGEEALKQKIAEQEKLIEKLKADVAALQEEVNKLKAEKEKGMATAEARAEADAKVDVPKLIAKFRDKSSERFKARQELRKIGKGAVPFLIEATKAEHPFVVQAAIQTLGDIEDLSAVPALLEVLQSDNAELAAESNRALGKTTKQYFGIIGLDETPEERKAVIENWKKWWEENKNKAGGQ
jgi:hypothetical protein